MLYLRAWFSYASTGETKRAKWETEKISAYYVGVRVSQAQVSMRVFPVAHTDREESVSEMFFFTAVKSVILATGIRIKPQQPFTEWLCL